MRMGTIVLETMPRREPVVERHTNSTEPALHARR
jgi:hypothetical protein